MIPAADFAIGGGGVGASVQREIGHVETLLGHSS